MDRVRIVVLVAFAATSVAVYLLAPDDGLAARTPTLVLIGVLALCWHLALAHAGVVGTGGSAGARNPAGHELATPNGPASLQPAGYFDLEPAVTEPEPVTSDANRITPTNQSELPDPPSGWSPSVVQVPRAFQLSEAPDAVIDLRAELVSHEPPRPSTEPVIEALPGMPPEHRPGLSVTDVSAAAVPVGSAPTGAVPAGSSGEDPWLAFAASMLASKD